ncbi:MAG: DUF523 domain-containing protein [Candidatus Magasanikbacteria bacterium]|nr:DUF523 domain-containing protein [Candidatus Magasanikbacteria bacterium]
MKIAVSACLLGVNCRYNGKAKGYKKILDLAKNNTLIPVCPEQLAGLPTPREAAENLGENVVTKSGKNLTSEFKKGATEALRLIQITGCKKVILKERSPSCGSHKVYDGTFSNSLRDGNGVFAKLLKQNNIEVLSEEDLN